MVKIRENYNYIYIYIYYITIELANLNMVFIKIFFKVEFYQPSCWLYFVSNLLVFQQLVTLYLGGILVKVVSKIV